MSNHRTELALEQEEAAQGRDLYRAPGRDLLAEQARDQAEAPGWSVEENIHWPSTEIVDGVAERRHELYETMRRLEATVARPSGLADWRMEIEAAITDLYGSLDEHIRCTESDDGLFPEVVEGYPHLAPRIAVLETEHTELRAACRIALSTASDWSSAELRRKANILLTRLAIHRQNGAELLYDAYNVDIATGD